MASTSKVDNSKRKGQSPEESSCRKRHRLSFEEQDNEPSTCVICLQIITNKSFANNCLHTFCFECLLKWSEERAECPLCKGPFTAIIHNVKSDQEYDEHIIESIDEDRYLNSIVNPFSSSSSDSSSSDSSSSDSSSNDSSSSDSSSSDSSSSDSSTSSCDLNSVTDLFVALHYFMRLSQ
ncbi:E3 ubiquitin-protein ligase Topors-like isoform X1 [Daphnia pulicaria]|uniref:E3 ubiquitin-protein ligase Topors-like isoform X1 n=1 Tax=Daphnia pulicaria TaxID=35523 RepID=UPI001EEC4091|nr:E3 ubiquitin-protein ligase Topors-like isoform X1 [Daphnia pulicaria]